MLSSLCQSTYSVLPYETLRRFATKKIPSGVSIYYTHGLFGKRGDMRKLEKVMDEVLVKNIGLPVKHNHLGLLNHSGGRFADEHESHHFVDDLRKGILNTKDEDPDRLNIFVGHSMGGSLGFQMASRYPNLIDGIVLLDIVPAVGKGVDVAKLKFSSSKYTSDHKPFSIGAILQFLVLIDYAAYAATKVGIKLPSREWINEKLQYLSGWKSLKSVGQNYVLRAYNPRNGGSVWDHNMHQLRRYFKYGHTVGLPLNPYTGPTLLIRCTESEFATPARLAHVKLPRLEVVPIQGGHWILANKSQLQAVAAHSSEWIKKTFFGDEDCT